MRCICFSLMSLFFAFHNPVWKHSTPDLSQFYLIILYIPPPKPPTACSGANAGKVEFNVGELPHTLRALGESRVSC